MPKAKIYALAAMMLELYSSHISSAKFSFPLSLFGHASYMILALVSFSRPFCAIMPRPFIVRTKSEPYINISRF